MTASQAPIYSFDEDNENVQGPAQAVGGVLSHLKLMESVRCTQPRSNARPT
jgi:hypothetical protein